MINSSFKSSREEETNTIKSTWTAGDVEVLERLSIEEYTKKYGNKKNKEISAIISKYKTSGN